MRGLSEANGSWKTICIERRCGRSSALPRWVMSSPLSRMLPPVGSTSRRMAARHRRFAAAGFADQPERFADAEREADAVDGMHGADARGAGCRCAPDNASSGRYFEQRRARRSSCGPVQFRRAPAGRQMIAAASPAAADIPRWQRAIASRQRGAKAQPFGRLVSDGTMPGISTSRTSASAPGDGTAGIEAIRPRV